MFYSNLRYPQSFFDVSIARVSWHTKMKMLFTIIPFILALLPDKPTDLTVTNIKSRTARMYWVDPNNAGDGNLTGFWIKLKKENFVIQNITNYNENEYEIHNLTSYTTYKISVAAGNKHGFGEETITSFKTSEEGKIDKRVDNS